MRFEAQRLHAPRRRALRARHRWFDWLGGPHVTRSSSIRVQLSPARVKTMTEQAREVQGGGTWGTREAAAEWRRGAAARLQAFGRATEMMLDLVNVTGGSWVLDVGAGAGGFDIGGGSTRRLQRPRSSHRRLCEHVGGRRRIGTASRPEQR